MLKVQWVFKWNTFVFNLSSTFNSGSLIILKPLCLSSVCLLIFRSVSNRKDEKPEVSSQVSSQISNPKAGKPHSGPHVRSSEVAPMHTLL